MRVLWLCNIMLPAYARAHNLEYSFREGWLSGCLSRITEGKKDDVSIELGVCFPAEGDIAASSEVIDSVTYYGFREDLAHPETYDGTVENRFHVILDDFKPDIVHIFGTEFPHSLAMIRAFGEPSRVLLGIQGICTVIADEYMAGIPEEVQRSATFRDRIKEDSLLQQQEKTQKKKTERPVKAPSAERRSAKLEREIAKLEEKLASLQREAEEHAADYQKLMELDEEKAAVDEELLRLYGQWEELNA